MLLKKTFRVVGWLINLISASICFFLATAFVFEYFIVDQPDRSGKKRLHQTTYYGKPLDQDPYAQFVQQILHPYYIFGLAYEENEINGINNSVVSLDSSGFRETLSVNSTRTGVVTGGSAAFGHYASDNAKTLSSQLSRLTGVQFYNRAAPSWNSHQEMLALAKYRDKYQISVSFSLANDISIYCYKGLWNGKFPDQMESFEKLQTWFRDIRKPPIVSLETSPMFLRLRAGLEKSFPMVMHILHGHWEDMFPEGGPARGMGPCEKNIDGLVEIFLHNQKTMRALTESRGGVHLLVIQPMLEMHLNAHVKESGTGRVRRKVVESVMASDFCKTGCLDFSRLFSDKDGNSLKFGKWHYSGLKPCFVDAVHLGDDCMLEIATAIVRQANL